MSDTEKNLNKLLVITEKETQRIIQQFVRKSSTFSDECLEEYDLNNISCVKEISRYGVISSKITKNDTFCGAKCLKLANIQVIVWKNALTKELIIIFVENNSAIVATNKTVYTVQINLTKNAIRELKPVKYTRVTNRRQISRRNVTRSPKRNAKTQVKYEYKSSNKKLEQKSQKPRFLKSTKNLEYFLKNTIDKDTRFTSKYITAIFTSANATKSEDVTKIFLSRHIRYKNDLNNFVNAMEEICPTMKRDKYEYIRQKIDKNHIAVDNIKSIAFMRKKYVKIFLRKSIGILKKFSKNSVNKSFIKIGGEHFINVKNLNMKLETIKLFTPNKSENIEKNIASNIEIEEIHDKHEAEKCIQRISQELTIISSPTVDKSHKPKIITSEATEKLTKDINEKLKMNIKEFQTVTSNKPQAKSPRKEEMVIVGKNLLKQDPKPVVNKAQVDNIPVIVNKDIVLSRIQESLKIVTKSLAKNTQIIREIANKSSQFVVRGSQIPLQSRELLRNNTLRKNKVTEINREMKKSNNTSQISLKPTMEQNQILQKLKQDKKLVTITPIRNYIVDNKRKVCDKTIRTGSSAQKVKKSSKNSTSITPVINSKYIVENNSPRKTKECPKLNDIKPVIQSGREASLIGKIMRPVPKDLPESQDLDNLTVDDLIPFRSEYPRKDHLNSLSKPSSRLDSFLDKLCSSNCLEPLIKCSDKQCKSCAKLTEIEPAMKREKQTDMEQKKNNFDFQQYINEPSTSYRSNYILYPITEIQISPKIYPNHTGQMKSPNCNADAKKSVPISTITKPKQLSGDISKNSLTTKTVKKTQNFVAANKIQKTIEQSISKNNGQQKIVKQITKSVDQSRTATSKTLINNRKVFSPNQSKQNVRNLAPKIFTPRRSNIPGRTVQNKVNPIFNKRKVNVTKNDQREFMFDQKYKINKNICDPLKASKNMLLETMSKANENSHNDIQKYLAIIEQKFLKTFSLPEEEKVDAYNTLAQEINGMLSILSTENAGDKQLKIIESLERLTNMNGCVAYTSQSYEKVSNSMKNFKFSTHSLTDLAPKLLMVEETISSKKIKKKVADDAQPTVCTESINFMKSLSAIMSKQTQLFPAASDSKNDELKKPTSILKITSSCQVNNAKKVRFGAHDSKHLKSDVSVTFSTSSSDDDDEDYSTIFEKDVINFTSEEDVTLNCPEFSSLIYFKTDILNGFVENLTEISYVILVFHQIVITDQNSVPSIDYKTEPDKAFIKTSKSEVKINDFDVKFSKSNFTFSSSIASTANSNCTVSDISNSTIDIDNLDYIPVEAKGSPNVIEFLNIMANLSFEPVPYREEMFYKTTICYIDTTYESTIYYSINIFHETEIHCTNNLQALVPKLGEQSKQLSELTGNVNFNLHPRLVSMKPSNLHRQYLEFAYRMQKEKYDTLMSLRQTRSLNMMLPIQNIHNQTLVLNMHVQNYQQSQIEDGNINSKCSEDKKHLRKAENNCTIISNENEKIHRSYKSILIFLYIAIFSTILCCTFLTNYKCE